MNTDLEQFGDLQKVSYQNPKSQMEMIDNNIQVKYQNVGFRGSVDFMNTHGSLGMN